jgi:hypothetical protein
MQNPKRSPVPTPISTILFVTTQLVLVVIASAGMSRCSPLAPSEQLGAAATPPLPAVGAAPGPGVSAVVARQELALQLNTIRSTLITQSVVTDAEAVPQAQANSVVLVLNNDQKDALFQGNSVLDISILENLKSQGLSDDAARARFLSVRAIPDNQLQVKLISYILTSRNIAARIGAGNYTFAINDSDGLIRLHTLPDVAKNSVRNGYAVVLEITQK